MNRYSEINIRRIPDDGNPIKMDPTMVGCGFLTCPKELWEVLKESDIHESLDINKTQFWAAVRKNNPNISVHLLTSVTRNPVDSKKIEPNDVIVALDKIGKYPGHSIAVDIMKLSEDGGQTFISSLVGFSYKAKHREIIIAGPQMIIPGKPSPEQSFVPPRTAVNGNEVTAHKKPWWAFWK